MYKCDYCQRGINKVGVCPDCGTTIYMAGGQIVYGATAKDSCGCEVAITEKYLIIRKVSKAESTGTMFGNAGGLLGIVLTDAVRKSIVRPYGFYALSNIQKGIFPYQTNGLKKKNAIKLINKDGTDFILIFDKPGMVDGTKKVLKKMVEYIRAAIPVIEDGSDMNYGNAHCINPFVTLETLDKVKSDYAMSMPHPVQQAVVQAKTNLQSEVTPIQKNTRSEDCLAQQQVVQTDSKTTKVQCLQCGTYVFDGSKFCHECGQKIEPICQAKRCKQCGTILDYDDKFCYKCGSQVQ